MNSWNRLFGLRPDRDAQAGQSQPPRQPEAESAAPGPLPRSATVADSDRPSRVWKARPIFISSTSRDMDAERDHLRSVDCPRLADRLHEQDATHLD